MYQSKNPSEILKTLYNISCGNGTPDVEDYRTYMLRDQKSSSQPPTDGKNREGQIPYERINHAAAQWKVTTFTIILVSPDKSRYHVIEKTSTDSLDFYVYDRSTRPYPDHKWKAPNSTDIWCFGTGPEHLFSIWNQIRNQIQLKVAGGYKFVVQQDNAQDKNSLDCTKFSCIVCSVVYSLVLAHCTDSTNAFEGFLNEVLYIGIVVPTSSKDCNPEDVVCTLLDKNYSTIALAPYESVSSGL
jgi:hypothetical protein